ncbi:MAG TPA: lipocalin family protein [Flavisolibacter sp.]|nr:lipocalin family protein [Flavisolibacter sp.]
MDNNAIIDTWIGYKMSNGEREDLKEEKDASRWTFQADGTVTYQLANETKDKLQRRWKIQYSEDGPSLFINDVETYRIITLENGILILESIKGDGIRHFYANEQTYHQQRDQLP